MEKPEYNRSTIRLHASPQSFERGCDYYERGAVQELIRRGHELLGTVRGSQYTPYQVRVLFEGGSIREAGCDCPYDWGGWCKHIVAVLLAYLHEPDAVEDRADLGTVLDDLDALALRALVQHLISYHPDLMNDIEHWRALHRSGDEAGGPATIDPGPIRRKVHALLHGLDHMRRSEAYWHIGSVVNEVHQVLGEIQDVLEAGKAEAALVLLEALTDEYVQEWTWLDDSDGFVHAFFYDLEPVWTEALLAADLDDQARSYWADRLRTWQSALYEYGMDEVFFNALAAVDPNIDGLDSDALVNARLNILERQGEYEAFLNLARTSGQAGRYTVMLARMGRFEEAEEIARGQLTLASEAHTLAQVLLEQGAALRALNIAEHGLTLAGGYEKAELAVWLRSTAGRLNNDPLALKAALAVVQAAPSLDAYRAVEVLAGEQWSTHRPRLLEHLRTSGWRYMQGAVDIMLHEGQVDDAIDLMEKGYAGYDLIRRVAEAAINARPDWVIETGRRHAEEIMDRGASQHYRHAAEWLRLARDAYRAAGRKDEWTSYRTALIDQHQRKYKLRPMLEQL